MNLAPPTSWQTMGALGAALFVATAIFLCTAPYSRTSVADGVVESDLGTVRIGSGPGGVVTDLRVAEGQKVVRGQLLAVLTRATLSPDGALEDRRREAIDAEGRAIAAREASLRAASEARVAAILSEARSAGADQQETAAQIAQQRGLVDAARVDLDKAREIAARGFVSQRDVRVREESYASRLQGLSRLTQQAAAARSAREVASRRVSQERADLEDQLAQMRTARAGVEGRSAEEAVSPVIRVVSPVDGTVSDLAGVVRGASLASGQTVATVLPDGGRLRLRLRLPAATAALVAPGQEVRVSLDAFPYQTYGTIPARIARVSESTVAGEGGAFVAVADLSRTSVSAYGTARPVRPGMTVHARIRIMRRTLAQWLLDPLYAVATR